MADVVEIDASTGEVIERDFTPEELAQRLTDEEQAAVVAEALAEREAARAADRAALLERLGLTEEEAALLLGAGG